MKAVIFIRINSRQIKNKSKEQETWISISENRNYVFRGVNGMRSYDEHRKNLTPVKKGGCRVNAFAMPGMYYRWKKDDTIYDGWFMNCVTDCETNENRV